MKDGAPDVIQAKIQDTYEKEHAVDALSMERTAHSLIVSIAWCPAIKHLHATGRTVSDWYHYTTDVVMDVLARKGRLVFTMESYDPDTGAARYRFDKI